MTRPDDGGMMFPSLEFDLAEGRYEIAKQHHGITLRDWLAGQALNGMLSFSNTHPSYGSVVANTAYDFADAMIAERNRRTEAP